MKEIPIYEKINLTIEEAAAYSNVGINTIRRELRKKDCPFALRIGKRTLVKRKDFEKFLSMRTHL